MFFMRRLFGVFHEALVSLDISRSELFADIKVRNSPILG
ncbi:hypothetical protein HMPREF0578_0738 [Mobiluncus mulieris 28-1]|nr:hypothetical protein HMPREF0578_0738 [Mobiluncus mulieris 28-1]